MDNSFLSLAAALNIPIKSKDQRIWLLRTESGRYYTDFKNNSYVALGWNEISKDVIMNDINDYKPQKEIIQELYPEEKRPGLILSQMNTFYTVMKKGDIIIIPSEGSRTLSIGILGDLTADVEHVITDEDYIKCEFVHKRKVEWKTIADQSTDIYLSKVLKSHQTISDITEYSAFIYRNLFNVYIDEENLLHLTIFKKSANEFKFDDYLKFFSSINTLREKLAVLYNDIDDSNNFYVKSAVGSPGFIEIILTGGISAIALIKLICGALGKIKGSNGESITGICALLSQINNMQNDHKKRQLADVEIEEKKMDVELKKVDLRLKNAEADRYERETQKMFPTGQVIQIDSNTNSSDQEQTNLALPDISENSEQIQGLIEPCEQIAEIASRNNITIAS